MCKKIILKKIEKKIEYHLFFRTVENSNRAKTGIGPTAAKMGGLGVSVSDWKFQGDEFESLRYHFIIWIIK